MTHSRSLRSALFALAGLLSLSTSLTAAELRLFLWEPTDFGSDLRPISLDDAGLTTLDEIFSRHFACGNGHGEAGELVECSLMAEDADSGANAAAMGKQASITYRLARMLITDPKRRRVLESVSRLGSAQVLDVQFRLADGVEDLNEGSLVNLPSGATLRLDGPKTLEELATENNTTTEYLELFNHRTLEIWPHALSRDGRVRHGGQVVQAGSVNLGEKALETAHDSLDDAWATLIHEASHISDNAPAPEDNYRYGPSKSHNVREIISPHAAFGEGWAYFMSAAWDPSNPSLTVTSVTQEEAPTYALIDNLVDPENPALPYDLYLTNKVRPSQRLSVELTISRVLYQIHRDSGVEAYGPMLEAFQATNDLPGRHLGDFMKALSEAIGDDSHLDVILGALQRESGMTREQALEFYRQGRFPDGRHGGSAPGAPVQVSVEVPVAQAQVPGQASGLFGLD